MVPPMAATSHATTWHQSLMTASMVLLFLLRPGLPVCHCCAGYRTRVALPRQSLPAECWPTWVGTAAGQLELSIPLARPASARLRAVVPVHDVIQPDAQRPQLVPEDPQVHLREQPREVHGQAAHGRA